MSAGLIPSTDSFATGDPDSAFFLRPGQPIATPSPLQILSADAEVVASVEMSNSGVLTIGIDGSLGEVVISHEVTVDSLVATGLVQAQTINADLAASRIVIVNSGAGGSAVVTTAVPGLTTNGRVFAQQVSSGAAQTPVVAQCLANSLVLTAAGNFPNNTIYWVYIAAF